MQRLARLRARIRGSGASPCSAQAPQPLPGANGKIVPGRNSICDRPDGANAHLDARTDTISYDSRLVPGWVAVAPDRRDLH